MSYRSFARKTLLNNQFIQVDKSYLQAFNIKHVKDDKLIHLLSEWRRNNQMWFPSQFDVTDKRTKRWLKTNVILNPDRILYGVYDEIGLVGHLGFNRFDYDVKSSEIDNVIRGISRSPGIMTKALNTLVLFGYDMLGLKEIGLTVFEDNVHAIRFYKRCGFEITEHIPLHPVIYDNEVRWEECDKGSAKRYNVKMIHS